MWSTGFRLRWSWDFITLLYHSFVTQSKVLKWRTSYLTGRFQCVHLSGKMLFVETMRYGVPQSSFLRPLLFLLYAADIITTVEQHGLSLHFYLNDSQLYFYYRSDDTQSRRETTLVCISGIDLWMSSFRRRFKPSKKEFPQLATWRRIHRIDDGSFHVGDGDVTPSKARGSSETSAWWRKANYQWQRTSTRFSASVSSRCER